MSNRVPKRIVDKNGKATTVYVSAGTSSNGSAAVSNVAPSASRSLSKHRANFERFASDAIDNPVLVTEMSAEYARNHFDEQEAIEFFDECAAFPEAALELYRNPKASPNYPSSKQKPK